MSYGKGSFDYFLCYKYASSDENEATQLLIDHGAKVNSTNKKGATPLIIAAVKGHHSVLRILAFHPQIQLH
jgi:ankyrin repeat protein